MQAQATSIQYQCTACSSPLARWSARCPACSALGTVRTLTQDAQEALLRRFASDGEIARGIGKTPPPSTPETISPVAAVAPSPPEIAPLPSRTEPVRITSVEEREHPRVSSGLSSLDRVLGGGIVPASVILFGGEPGIGKCLGRGTPVLMFDGRVLNVEQILPGDLLMGPDGAPRTVLGTNSGSGELFRVEPIKGEPWICNADHVLTVVHSITNEVHDISISELSSSTSAFRHYAKLFSVGVDNFQGHDSDLPVDPYFLGLWFGDGTKELRNGQLAGVSVSKPDLEVKEACEDMARAWGLRVSCVETGNCPRYSIVDEKGKANGLTLTMRDLLGETLAMPSSYTRAPREQRLRFLAGLLDSDGDLAAGTFTITQKRKDWAREIWWMARSLGFGSVMTPRSGRCKLASGEIFEGDYWRVSIFGDVDQIPTRIPRKRAEPRKQIKKANRTGFSIEPIGPGEYFGFQVDGDGRFLLGDFTVTHNSTLLAQALARASRVVGRRVLYVTGEETIEQATMRARRVDAAHDDVWIVAESEVQTILSYVQRYEPAIVAIDSIQTVHDPDIGAAPGSLVQVRHCAGMIASFSKRSGTTTIIVGHVTKDGAIAGPKTLEHLVDVTLQLELGEHTDSRFRYLRAHKNRFGSTQEVGAFEMAAGGMLDIEEQEAREQDRKAVDRGDSEAARLRRALRAAIETWCPRDPGGDGADGETYRLALEALGDRT